MKNHFQHQTGNIDFELSFWASSTTGMAEIAFGCEGISDRVISFELKSGELLDNDGILFGSYVPNQRYSIEGSFYTNHCNYFYNGTIIRPLYETENSDINTINLTKGSGDTTSYGLLWRIKGLELEDRKLLYITNSQNESGIINIATGMDIFRSGVETGYSRYSGELEDYLVNEINEFDLIIFGQYLNKEDFTDRTGWARIHRPIIFLNPTVINQDGLGIVTGTLTEVTGNEMRYGYPDTGDEKYSICRAFARRAQSGQAGYELYSGQTGEYLNYCGANYDAVMYNGESKEVASIDFLNKETNGYALGLEQDGERVIFNVPNQKTSPLCDFVTEDWKKIFVACIYDRLEIGSQMQDGGEYVFIVTGAGTEDANGRYYETELISNGLPIYKNKNELTFMSGVHPMDMGANTWNISYIDDNWPPLYYRHGDGELPWETSPGYEEEWNAWDGDAPVPIVTLL